MDQKLLIGLVITIILIILIIVFFMRKQNEHYADAASNIPGLKLLQLQDPKKLQQQLLLQQQQLLLQQQKEQLTSGQCGDMCIGINCSNLALVNKSSNGTISGKCSSPKTCARVGTNTNYFNMCLTNAASEELSNNGLMPSRPPSNSQPNENKCGSINKRAEDNTYHEQEINGKKTIYSNNTIFGDCQDSNTCQRIGIPNNYFYACISEKTRKDLANRNNGMIAMKFPS
jgi:hypothetical protein